MKFFVMSTEAANRFLMMQNAGESPSPDEFQTLSGTGNAFDHSRIDRLGNELRRLMKKFPSQLKARDPEGGKFEQAACEIVHRHLGGLDRGVVANLDFWTWLAVVKFSDIVEWRFGTDAKRARFENYGVGGASHKKENLFFRLWLRADLGSESNQADGYRLAKTGDQDLWRSHILRQSYANAREVARALLKLQAGELRAKKLTVDGIRELAKRLRRLRANLVFEFLPAKSAEQLVVELSGEIQKAK